MGFFHSFFTAVASVVVATLGFFSPSHPATVVHSPLPASTTPAAIATTTARNISTAPVPTPTKTAAIPATIKATPVSNASAAANAQNVADLAYTLGKAASDLATIKSSAQSLTDRVNSDLSEFGPYLTAAQYQPYAQIVNLTVSYDDSLEGEIANTVSYVNDSLSRAESSGQVDEAYWKQTGLPAIVQDESTYTQRMLTLESEYSQAYSVLKADITADEAASAVQQQYTPQISPQLQAYAKATQTCQAEEAQIESQVRSQLSSGNGFTTEGQIMSIAASRMEQQHPECGY